MERRIRASFLHRVELNEAPLENMACLPFRFSVCLRPCPPLPCPETRTTREMYLCVRAVTPTACLTSRGHIGSPRAHARQKATGPPPLFPPLFVVKQ